MLPGELEPVVALEAADSISRDAVPPLEINRVCDSEEPLKTCHIHQQLAAARNVKELPVEELAKAFFKPGIRLAGRLSHLSSKSTPANLKTQRRNFESAVSRLHTQDSNVSL